MRNEIKSTIRLPGHVWMKIQRMKLAGLADSIQDAVLQGLVLLAAKHEDEIDRQRRRDEALRNLKEGKI